MESVKEDSLKKRYFYKLTTNLFGFAISIVTAGIVPRGLGVQAYGDFSFLTNFFTQIHSFFNTGISIGYYSKISSRPKEYKMTRFYWGFYFISISIISMLVLSSIIFGISNKIWPDINNVYICMAMFLGFITFGNNITAKIIDAYALTAKGETIKIIQKIIGTLILVFLFIYGWLNLKNYFIFQYFVFGFLIFAWWKILKKKNIPLLPKGKLQVSEIKRYAKEYYSYSAPLIVYGAVVLIIGIFDRWILQYMGGSIEQGYFGLAFRIGGLIFIFTSSLTPLILREFSIEYHKNNIEKMQQLFKKYIPLLYFIATYFAVFVSVHANEIVTIIGGDQYKSATISLMIISFYPLHQTYGQLCGSLFYATGQTKLYRNIGILFMIIGLPFTYLMLAPENMYGLNLGSIGLAIKMVGIQFIGVNALLWYNTKFLKLSFRFFLKHQFTTIIILLIPALLISYISNSIIRNQYLAFFVSGFIYTIIVMFIVYLSPSTINISRIEIKHFLSNLFNKIRKNGFRK